MKRYRRNKGARLEVLKMIIGGMELGTQEELLAELGKAGYESTQATLSRDLKQLRIVKAQNGEGRYVYMLPSSRIYHTVSERHVTLDQMNRLGAISVRFSGNIAVIKTLPGHAAHVGYDIDNATLSCVLGTIAGDDTVMVVLVEGTPHDLALNALSTAVPLEQNML